MTFESHLHISFQDEHVLFPFIKLDSVAGFFLASTMTVLVCTTERLLSVGLEKRWEPVFVKLGRRRVALWRTWMYSTVTFLRLCYMLIAMTFNVGLLLLIVATLSASQFFIELSNLPKLPSLSGLHEEGGYRPLPQSQKQHSPSNSDSIKTRPRSRSKPDDLFIHPVINNIARADAVAVQMGLNSSTEYVQKTRFDESKPVWQAGKGKDLAREMLLSKNDDRTVPHRQRSSDKFYIGDSDSDC